MASTAAKPEEKLALSKEWDKTFPLSDEVEHEKIQFHNRFGITLAADLYKPKTEAPEGGYPALAVSGPFGAVKEQASGLYAQTMAERGFLTIAFDPSFTGESGGAPRYMSSPDLNTEDFQAAVDCLVNRNDVNAARVGIIGICGWGGIALNAAAADTRIHATAAVIMYDMTRVAGNGYFDADDNEKARAQARRAFSEQRTKDYAAGTYELAGGVVDPLPQDAPQSVRDYFAYYKTPRGYAARSLNSNDGWAITSNISWAMPASCTTSLRSSLPSWSSTARRPTPATWERPPMKQWLRAPMLKTRSLCSCQTLSTATSTTEDLMRWPARAASFPGTGLPASSSRILHKGAGDVR